MKKITRTIRVSTVSAYIVEPEEDGSLSRLWLPEIIIQGGKADEKKIRKIISEKNEGLPFIIDNIKEEEVTYSMPLDKFIQFATIEHVTPIEDAEILR